MILPIAPSVMRSRSAIRDSFHSDYPLPRFAVIPNFLRQTLIKPLVRACQQAEYATFCAYRGSKDGEMRNEFCEPNEGFLYLSIHQRPTRPVEELVRLRHLFAEPQTIAEISEIAGIKLDRLIEPDALTCWGPESFLEGHTDHSPGSTAKLVVSLSLTTAWRATFGGTTVFAWRGLNRAVRVRPRLNTAVLFTPFSGSWHWVEQISENAPPRRRFTWTVFFS